MHEYPVRVTAIQEWRGQRLGLPRDGAGSVAGFGRRIAALTVDWVPCAVVADLFTANPQLSAMVFFAVLTVASVTLFGRSPGHAAAGIRVAMLEGGLPRFPAVVVRTVLICLVIPPVVYNADGRGLHDRAAGTVVLRTR